MNFVLFHIGNDLPPHIKHCVQQIQKTNPNSHIYILTNLNIIINNPTITIIPTQKLIIPDIGNYYLHDPMGPLFRNAMLRLYYLEAFLHQYDIEDIIHFDNDVLIYENITTIADELKKHNFLITSFNPLNYVFGFSYIKNGASFAEINAKMLCLIVQGEKTLERLIGSMPHEMRLMQYVNTDHQITLLPVLPTDKNFENFNYCFDPSSYGQYLGGAAPEADKYIGSKIIENKIQVLFDNHKPYVILGEKKYNIFNLHVHNKQLENFL